MQVLPQTPEEFFNERYIRHVMKERRGVAVFVPTRAEVERWPVNLGDAVATAHHRVLPRRRADPGDPPLSGGRSRAAVPSGDDRGRAVGAQRARARHRDHLRCPVRQRGGAGPQRAPPPVSRRQRDPPDGGPGARAGAQRRGRDPERPPARLRPAPAHAARIPARGRRRASGDHLRRLGVDARDLDLPVAARPDRLPAGAWSCSPVAG